MLGWLVVKINALGDGDGVINNCFRNLYLSNVNLLQKVIFLFLHIVAMLGNDVSMLGSIIIALGSWINTMDTLFVGLGVVYKFFWTN